MKNLNKVILILLVFVFAFSFAGGSQIKTARADNISYSKTATIIGVGSVLVRPDVAIIDIGVETSNLNVSLAEKENSEKVQAAINLLIENNINKEDVKNSYFNVYKQYDYSNGQKLIGYNVSNMLTIKVRDTGKTSEIISLLISSGANVVNGVNFTVENKNEIYKQALKNAISNAVEKFEVLTNGVVNYEITEIIEKDSDYYYNSYSKVSNMESTDGVNSIVAGEFKVDCKLEVKFSFN